MDVQQLESKRLRRDVEGALRRALDPSDVLPLLHRLARTAPVGSDESLFAHRQLAELLVERHPWRATLHARKVILSLPDDDRAWAVLALCQSLLGNYRYAVSAYHRALMCSPKNPWYAHNLGHLLDVALGRANDALVWLRTAYAGASGNAEIAASFAHALARAGKLGEAKKVLLRAMKRGPTREQTALWKWVEKGAPAEKNPPPPPRPTSMPALVEPSRVAQAGAARKGELGPPSRRTVALEAAPGKRGVVVRRTPLEAALARGLSSLPLDAKQRARARALARDPVVSMMVDGQHLDQPALAANDPELTQSLAAAIAYAIVYVDHVPLTQGEVAACFRVGAAGVRGRFRELRAQLDLTPGDARFATRRA